MSFGEEPEEDDTEEKKTQRLEAERLERARLSDVKRNTTTEKSGVRAQPSFFKKLLGGS